MGRILIAEDEKSVSSFLVSILEDLGHEVYVSPNGEHALETLDNNEGFQLLISDMMMPKIDGHQLTRRVLEDYPAIPIIVISGYVKLSEIDELLQEGVQAFIPKPINFEELTKYVSSAMKHQAMPEIH